MIGGLHSQSIDRPTDSIERPRRHNPPLSAYALLHIAPALTAQFPMRSAPAAAPTRTDRPTDPICSLSPLLNSTHPARGRLPPPPPTPHPHAAARPARFASIILSSRAIDRGRWLLLLWVCLCVRVCACGQRRGANASPSHSRAKGSSSVRSRRWRGAVQMRSRGQQGAARHACVSIDAP